MSTGGISGAAFAASAESARKRFGKKLRVESRYEEETNEVIPLISQKKGTVVEETAWPETVECYLGPTNSGKTWRSLEFMAEKGAGCYAGPLRALAWEVRLDLIERCEKYWRGAPPQVGLWTGEEKINIVNASILCCTAEVCPTRGEILVLDEVHWCADRQRGAAWTKLLLAARDGRFRHVRICGPNQAADLLRTIFAARKALEDRSFVTCRRRSKLLFMGVITASSSQNNNKKKKFEGNSLARFLVKTCLEEKRRVAIIAFSRNAVLSLAAASQKAGVRASALFGKLPPEARRSQLEAARRGELDVMVTTDVIGHGLNLPIDDVVFTETRKRDMSGDKAEPQLRSLKLWEAAQIAGRAGRDEIPGRAWVLQPTDVDLIRSAVDLANGDEFSDIGQENTLEKTSTYRVSSEAVSTSSFIVEHCVLSPQLDEIAALCPENKPSLHLFPNAIRQWARQLSDRPELPSWFRGADIAELIERLNIMLDQERVPEDVSQALTLQLYWQLALLPVRRSNFQELATAAALTQPVRPPQDLNTLSAESLEDEVQRLGDVIIASRRFTCLIDSSWGLDDAIDSKEDDNDDDTEQAMQARRLAAAEDLYLEGSRRIGNHIQECIEIAALCKNCGQPKNTNNKPSDMLCRNCFLLQQKEKQKIRTQEPGTPVPPSVPVVQRRQSSGSHQGAIQRQYSPASPYGNDMYDGRTSPYHASPHLYSSSPTMSGSGNNQSYRSNSSSRGRGGGRQKRYVANRNSENHV